MAFAPTAAVLVYSHVPISQDVLETLKAEDGLLIFRCSFSATRPVITRSDINGREFLRAYGPLDAAWNVQARQLQRTGLANYHPGRTLNETSLAFANAEFVPFQIGTTFEQNQNGQAVFIYENPSLDPGPGDLPTVEFTIRLAFADLDTENYPTTNPGTPASPSLFVNIDPQDAVELSAAARTALLEAAFNGNDPFGDEPMTASLYDADDALLMGPVELAAWTTFDDSGATYRTRARNTAQIQWDDSHYTDRTAAYVRLDRNGIILRDIALATPLVIPAYYGVRAPVNALGVTLTWPTDADSIPSANRASEGFVGYAMGGALGDVTSGTTLDIEWWDGDPQDGGTPLDTLTVNADATNFPVSGLVMTPEEQTGPTVAPGGGWSAVYVTITNPEGYIIAKEEYLISVAATFPLTLNAVTPPAIMKLDLEQAPDP